MVKDIKKASKRDTKKNAKPYEPAKIEIVTFSKDVILASSYHTKGTYDNGWKWDWH